MITIKRNGKFVIPEGESFIGYEGDNLNARKEFFVEQLTDVSLIYRMYLEFDDGTVNFFILQSEVGQGGTRLVWDITNDQIFKSGLVKLQIKGSNSSGTVFHSAVTTVIVSASIEFGESFGEKANSEFLRHEEYLNSLVALEQENRAAAESLLEQISQGASQASGLIDTEDIADGAITNEKIELAAISQDKLQPRVQTAIETARVALKYVDSTDAPISTLAQLSQYDQPHTVYMFTVSGELSTLLQLGVYGGIATAQIINGVRYIHTLTSDKWFRTDRLQATTVTEVGTKLSVLGISDHPVGFDYIDTFSRKRDELYAYMLAAGELYEGSPIMNVLLMQVDSTSQIIIAEGTIYSRSYSSQSGTWSNPLPSVLSDADGVIRMRHFNGSIIAVSGQSSAAWPSPNDSTIPTTAFVKNWLNRLRDEISIDGIPDNAVSWAKLGTGVQGILTSHTNRLNSLETSVGNINTALQSRLNGGV